MAERKRVKKKNKAFKALKIMILTLITIIILGTVAFGGVVLAIIKTAPTLDVNEILTLNEPSTLYTDKDEYMDDVITDQKRTIISIKEVPDDLKKAVISIEDERFYQHHGIDLKRIAGVIYIDFLNIIKKQPGLQGASTITQQLLKNTILSSEVSFKRKMQEMYLAVKLENSLTKDQILEAYLNTIPLGGMAYGVEAASNQYFDKKAKDLTLLESAFIAGITQTPSRYYSFAEAVKKDPQVFNKKDPYVINRTKNVLAKMLANNAITKDRYESAINELEEKNLVFKIPSFNVNKLNYEWFSRPAIDAVKKDLKNQYHYTDTEIDSLIVNGGLKIYTTMDKNLQNTAQKVVDDDNNLGIQSVKNEKGIIQPQASAVIMDYHTGQVKTIIGGRGVQPPNSYNRAASNNFLRPSGSSIKPLSVYSAAIDSKSATAATIIEDSPLPEEIGKLYGSNGVPYNPRNYETGAYSGNITLREALKHSVNLVAIKLEHQIGLKTGAAYATKFGLTLDNHDKTSISALSLGQLHNGTNPLTMAAAYGVFGNNGMYSEPKLYRKVVDKKGMVILENKPVSRKVLSPQSSFIMYDLLKGPVSAGGTAPNAKFSDMPVVGKTGTSGDFKDFWFCGLTPYYSGAVWIGNDTPKTYSSGIYSSTSATLWSKIMAEAHKNLEPKDIEEPSDIVRTSICSVSGELPNEFCATDPNGSTITTELFIEGTSPTNLCSVHVEATTNKEADTLGTGDTSLLKEPAKTPSSTPEVGNGTKTTTPKNKNTPPTTNTNNGAPKNTDTKSPPPSH